MSTVTHLMTAEEYALQASTAAPTELVQGEIVETNLPVPRHGQICSRLNRILGSFVDEHRLGHLVANDAGIVTERNPDTVGGADFWYVSYDRIPPGPLPSHYLTVAPEIVLEVLSPPDRPAAVLRKVAEYLDAGVRVVCLLDPQNETVRLYFPDREEQLFSAADDLTLEPHLPGFRVAVARLFE